MKIQCHLFQLTDQRGQPLEKAQDLGWVFLTPIPGTPLALIGDERRVQIQMQYPLAPEVGRPGKERSLLIAAEQYTQVIDIPGKPAPPFTVQLFEIQEPRQVEDKQTVPSVIFEDDAHEPR